MPVEVVEHPDDRFYRCWKYVNQLPLKDREAQPTAEDLQWFEGRKADKRANNIGQRMVAEAERRWDLENPHAPKTQIPGTGGARAV